MKTNFLKSLLVIVGLFSSMNASAYDVEIDGIYYNVVTKLKKAEVAGGNISYSSKINIPETITYNGVICKVSSIKSSAFSQSDIKSINIPNSVEEIGTSAFDGCYKLTSVSLPNTLKEIAEGTFSLCYSLNQINIPDSIKKIGASAFCSCYGIESITLPNSEIAFGESCFMNCSNLNTVNVSSIASWLKMSFSICGNPLTYANNGSLYVNGEKITDLVIPDTTTIINSYAFDGCSGLKSVQMPNSVVNIAECAFRGCKNLISVSLSNSLTSIEGAAFSDCINLTSIIIPNSVTSIGACAFDNCKKLEFITIPNSVTSIGWGFCRSCNSLVSLEFPKSIQNIGDWSLNNCSSLKSLTIPNSITSIGIKAFAGCGSLENVYCYAEDVPTTSSNAFNNSYVEYSTLYVPKASINNYKATAPWSSFGTIKAIEDIPSAIKAVSADNEKTSIRKFVTNGKIVIKKNGKLYDIDGTIQCTTH